MRSAIQADTCDTVNQLERTYALVPADFPGRDEA